LWRGSWRKIVWFTDEVESLILEFLVEWRMWRNPLFRNEAVTLEALKV